jgi:hypothetical protein
MENQPEKAPHILNTSANLLGICFFVLTSFKVAGKSEQTIVDEITAFAIILFMLSCLFSFLSIRSQTERSDRYEKIADIIFLGGLLILFLTTILFAFNIIA